VLLVEGGGETAALTPGELRWLALYPIPTIAAVRGEVSGQLLDLALACDIRVAEVGANFALPASREGRFAAVLGARGVAQLAASTSVQAEDALASGLVSGVAPAGGVLAAAQRIADAIAERGPIAERLAKEAIWRGLPQPLEQALRFETDLTLLLQTTKDRAEGVQAFLEKRPPTFAGR
jgi:enoyl-CoA hydratase/carnithine racemase